MKDILWRQFGAAIDMLENAIVHCPEDLWGDRTRRAEYWYMTYHTLFFLDYYLSESADGFAPPPPFDLGELDPAGVFPDRVYTKQEMLDYLQYSRRKLRTVLEAYTDETGGSQRQFGSFTGSFLELLLYNMRHVQHHTAQLNFILRETTASAPRWVGKSKKLLLEAAER